MKVINISVLTDKIIRLGRRGEGNVRQIVFDCTCLAETYGSGTAQLLHRRRGDEAPYPVSIEQNDNIVTWTVQESDTANVGIGEAEIIWMLPDGNAKSAVYETETLRSLSEPGGPPEPWQAWVDEVLKAAESGGATPEQIAGAVGKYLAEHPIEETDPTVPEWAKQPEKPTYTALEVGADTIGTSESKVSEHNVSDAAHNDIRLLVQGLTERLNALADSDDTTLDQMSEVVAYIKSNKSLIDAITTSKINVSDIIDNLTTNVSNKPLSAAQGVKLKALIDAITAVELDETLTDNTKAAPAGMVGELKGDIGKLSEEIAAIPSGADGKSAYQYAVDGGYTGTETEFAEKMAQEKFANPNALTFTGAVSATYDGSEALTVEIPSGGGSSGGSGKAKSQILIDQEITELTASLSVTLEHDFHNLIAIINSGSAGVALTVGSDGTAVASRIALMIDTTSFGYNSRRVAYTDTSTGTWKSVMCGAEWSDDLSVFKRGFAVEIATGAKSQYYFSFGGTSAMYGTLGTEDNAPRTGKTANIVVNGAYLNVGTKVVLWGEYYE